MKTIFKTLLALVLLFSVLNANEVEAEKLCNAESKKEQPQKSILKKQCSIVANVYEEKKDYDGASWYYLLAGENDKNIDTIQFKIPKNGNFGNVAHSYVLQNNLKDAKENYLKSLRNFDIPWADNAIQDDYKLLLKLYTTKKEQLEQGLKLWNEIYKPLLVVNELYPKYTKSRKEKKFQEAITYLSKVIEIQTDSHLQGQLTIAKNKFSLGVIYNDNHQYTKSLKILFEVEKIYEIAAKQEKKSAILYDLIANNYKNLQEYQKALSYYKKSLSIIEKVLGKNHTNTAESYNNIGMLYHDMGDYKQALIYYKKALEIREKVLGKEHIDTAISYNNIGILYQTMGDYKQALTYLKKALEIREKVLGKEHIDTAISYNNIGMLYQTMGDYKQALTYYKKALIIFERVLGENHAYTATSYNSIGMLYHFMGDYKQALIYHKKALEIYKNVLGKNHAYTATSYNNIGGVYDNMEDYKQALTYYKKALEIREKVLGKEHTNTATSYNNMGTLSYDMGDYKQALTYYKKALEIREKVLGKEHTDTAGSYNNIGMLYYNMGNYKQALIYHKKALEIYKKVLGKNHAYTAISYNSLGMLYHDMGDYKQTLTYLKKALEIREKVLGNDHTDTAGSYNNIGILYKTMGDYKQAFIYLKKSLAIYEKVLGKNHAGIATSYFNIGSLYYETGDYKQAYRYAKKSYDIFIVNRDKNFQILDNKQKKLYLNSNLEKVPLLLITSYLYGEKENSKEKNKLSQTTLTDWLNYKGAIYDSENAIVALYESTKDKALKVEIDELLQFKRNLARLYQTLPKNKEEKATYQTRIEESIKTITNLEKKISAKASSFKEELGLRDINYKDIAKNLKEDELYIDYANADEYYYIFALDAKNVITFNRIDENATKSINENIKAFRKDIDTLLKSSKLTQQEIKKLQEHSQKILSKLYDKALKEPLKEILPKYSSLIVSTDGALRLLPFETMFNAKTDKYLIEEKNIRYVPSGKELVRLFRSQNSNPKEKVVLFDNPNFDAKGVTVAQTDRLQTPNTKRAGVVKSLFKMRFSKLLGTKKEATAIKETLKGQDIQEFSQNGASENNLLKVKSPKILHIATHGFFINDNTIPNPMLKSGIALSGANTSAILGKSDGIVTSLKLSGLHLKGTKLVVLSACQTGVVDINSTENVSGLNKAFIQAGAKDIVMSLWSVADNETSQLMTDFYKNIQNNSDYANALRNAKMEMINKDIHPFFWAGFVLSGL